MQIPLPESRRLTALDTCRILDTPPEPSFDRISRLAAHFFSAPSAVISFVAQDRSWLKSRYGFEPAELSRQASFCAHTVLGHSPLIVPDARADERFANLPIVLNAPGIRFYAGVPLTTRDGFAVGTLGVMDTLPRGTCSDAQLSALVDFGVLLEAELNRRSDSSTRERADEALSRLAAVIQFAEEPIISVDLDGHVLTWNPAAERLYGYSADEVHGRSIYGLIVPPDRTREMAHLKARIKLGSSIPRFETVRVRKDGSHVSVSLSLSAIMDGRSTPIAISSIASDITQVKHAEAALRDTEEQLRLAQEAAGIGIWTWHIPEDTIVCSGQFLRLHGLSPRDSPLPFALWLSSVHPDDRERMRQYSHNLLRDKTHAEEGFRVVWPDGSLHWMVGKAKVHRSPDGQPDLVSGVALDVTALKLAEQARQESEEQYASLFRTMNQGVLYMDGAGVVLSANPAAERILGSSADQIRGRRRSDLHWQEAREDGSPLPIDETPTSISLRTGRERYGEIVRIWNSRTQDHRWLSIDAIPQFKAEETRPYQLYAIFQDITARVEAQKRLRASEERFRLLIEHGLEVIAILDASAAIRYVSASVARVLGYESDSLLGRNVLEYVHPDDRPVVQQAFEELVHSPNSTKSVQFRAKHRDGTWRTSEAAATNCLHVEGLRGIVANLRDITLQKAFEEQLQDSRRQLCQLTSHIESAREEERTRIAREVHDELGQILTVLKLDLEGLALKHRDRSPSLRKDFTESIAGIVRTVDLTINTVRRIAAELRPSILNDLGLSAALKWQIQEFESRTGVRCRFRTLREEPHLGAEPSIAVFRIFQEILTNVARHAKATSVSVALRTHRGWLALRVADDGQGLDPILISDPLSLGLIGMRERALQLGGQVDFTLRRGGGTVVTVRIPTGNPEAPPPL